MKEATQQAPVAQVGSQVILRATLRQPSIDKPRRRRRRGTENDEYNAFGRRIMRSWAKRAGTDLVLLGDFADAIGELDELLRAAVLQLREEPGHSWADIASVLGCSRQAAQQRFGGGER